MHIMPPCLRNTAFAFANVGGSRTMALLDMYNITPESNKWRYYVQSMPVRQPWKGLVKATSWSLVPPVARPTGLTELLNAPRTTTISLISSPPAADQRVPDWAADSGPETLPGSAE